ncbi:hypothetical protein GCM10027168_57190 [Streptomyces capparidis]
MPALSPALAAPLLLLAYGLVRLLDGLDGAHGPGPAWTVGHLLFLAGLLLFAATAFALRRPLAATGRRGHRIVAAGAVTATVLGMLAFARVVVVDIVVGLQASDNAAMDGVRARHENAPGLPPGLTDALYLAGPLLFQAGLLALLVQQAVLRLRPAWSPALAVLGFVLIAAHLDLLPLAAALLTAALATTTRVPATPAATGIQAPLTR